LNPETAVSDSDTIMGEIMMCNQDPEKLESKLIIHASKFTKRDFLEVARLLKR
jgi:repressor of nif and glnA expression